MSVEERTEAPDRWVRITVDLLHKKYDAGISGSGVAEWPPEPYRLFAALRAGAAGLRLTVGQEAEEQAVASLRRLESSPPPVVCASLAEFHEHAGFVPVIPDFRTSNPTAVDVGSINNRLKADAFPAITTSRGQRFYQSAVPAVPTVAFDLDARDLSDEEIGWLRVAAAEVPYFGRSTSPALLTVSAAGPLANPPAGTRAYHPGRGSRSMVVWAPGLLAALDGKHHALQEDLPMVGRALTTYASYGLVDDRPLSWFAFEREDAPFRAATTARTGLMTLAQDLGDGVDVALLANVANSFATGRLGIGVSIPEGVSPMHVRRLLDERGWSSAGGGSWLKQKTWLKDSAVFATATPVWLDTSSANVARRLVVEHIRDWGEAADVAVSRTPYLKGAERLRSAHAWHVALQFAKPLAGARVPWRLGEVDGVLLPLPPNERSVA